VIRVPAPAAPVATSRSTTASAASGQTHVVRRGETLSTIARRYGVTLSALRTANGMAEQDVLKAGARLRIP